MEQAYFPKKNKMDVLDCFHFNSTSYGVNWMRRHLLKGISPFFAWDAAGSLNIKQTTLNGEKLVTNRHFTPMFGVFFEIRIIGKALMVKMPAIE